MNRFTLIFSFLFIFICISCSNREPVIIKQDNQQSVPTHNPELIKEKNKENAVDEFIGFSLDGERVTINLQMIPILKQYLNTVNDLDKEVKEMNMLPIHTDNQTLYLLEFSCKHDACSYILIDQSKENSTYLVADLARYIHSESSPNADRLLLKFNRKSDFSTFLTNIIVIDLNMWEVLNLTHNETPTLLNYNRPIFDVNWVDDENISLIVPTYSEINETNIKEWNQMNNPTKTVILQITE